MAQSLSQAFKAYDGTIFQDQESCEAYEAIQFQKTTPMLYSTVENNQIVFTPSFNVTNVDFIQFASATEKAHFIKLRKEAAKNALSSSSLEEDDDEEEIITSNETTDESSSEEEEETISIMDTDYKYDWNYSVAGLNTNNQQILGVFVLIHTKDKYWHWVSLDEYQTMLEQQLSSSIDAGLLLSKMYTYN